MVAPLINLRSNSTMSEELPQATLAEMTSEIVSAYASHNQLAASELATLVGAVAGELRKVGVRPAESAQARLEPVVPVRRSIASDHLVCLVCGKKQKLLKRHLSTEHALTPEAYRSTFELKPDYPMAAPNYSEKRRELALRSGLGHPKKPAPKPRRKAAAQSRTKASATDAPTAAAE
jgi:predicted transcriptional regulator